MRIESIADHLDLVPLIARWHFNEWSHSDPTATLEGWTKGMGRRTKRDSIPTTYVALEDNELLGSVTLVEHDMSTHQDLSPWLAGVYVSPLHRHQGVASALVRHAVQQAARMDVKRLYLYTGSARRLYEKLGWRVLAEDDYEGQSITIMTIDTTASNHEKKGSCMAEKQTPTSPRITTLEQSITSGDPFALAAFWQEIAERGAPLIEPVEGDEGHYLVTFLWHDSGDTTNVLVAGGIVGWDKLTDNQMMRLLDSNLWYRTYQVGADLRTTYVLSHNDPLTGLENMMDDFGTRFIPDPLNPRQFIYLKDDEIPDDKEVIVSILELPGAPAQPWIEPRPGVEQGKLEMHRLHSRILDNERRVWVYTPPGYNKDGEPYGLLLAFDGLAYITLIPTPTILDNLLSEGKIPPLVAVLPDSLDVETRSRELPCYQPFVDYLTQELVPWVREHYHVTNNPAQAIVAGSSYGGLAAAFVGLRASETFGNVLSQSGSFWWDHNPEYDLPQERLIQQYIDSPRLPVRFYLEVGLQERSSGGTMILSNRHLRDILRLQGYEVAYDEFNGGHDYICWRGSLADGLMKLTSQI